MGFKQIVLSGLIAGLAAFLVGNVLYMNPLVSGLYSNFSDWPGLKSMDSFGGLNNWLILMLIGGLLSTVLLAILYSFTEKGLRFLTAWQKGLLFGVLLWLVSKVPSSYYTWLMYSYPDVLNLIETLNSLVGSIVCGIVLGIVYEKLSE